MRITFRQVPLVVIECCVADDVVQFQTDNINRISSKESYCMSDSKCHGGQLASKIVLSFS